MKVWIDGELADRDDARLCVFDHGLLYGDGVFEGIRVYEGKIFRCAEHVDRLFASARAIRLAVPMTKVAPVHLSFRDLDLHAAVMCNERSVGFFANEGGNFADVTLGNELRKGKNVLRLVLWGDVTPKKLQDVSLYVLTQALSDGARWGVRPWSTEPEPNHLPGAGRPAWFRSSFKYTPRDDALMLRIAGTGKGQMMLNGFNLGRFWTIGPQQHYYLPECHLAQENQITLFCEDGRCPTQTKLVAIARGA